MTTSLSILVVSYNTRDMTLACLRSVFDSIDLESTEVIVLDNASSDGSADAIAAECPDARLIRSETNLGFAGGNNRAASEARGEFLLLLNPDTVVLDDAIRRLLTFAEARPDAGIWGGRTIFADGSLNPASCWRRMTTWSLVCQAAGLTKLGPNFEWLNPEAYGGWRRDSEREVDIVSGCFFLIRRSLWEALGGFDEAFFMYGEEADLCLRARRRGAQPVVTPDATIVHYGGASERVRQDKVMRLYTAKAELVQRHFVGRSRSIGLILLKANILRRRVLWTVLALLRRDGAAENVQTFRELWRERRRWARGWSGSPTGNPIGVGL
ncbi:MAG: glycosyltransferase family 2 protein [Phycisphaerales bacterium]